MTPMKVITEFYQAITMRLAVVKKDRLGWVRIITYSDHLMSHLQVPYRRRETFTSFFLNVFCR